MDTERVWTSHGAVGLGSSNTVVDVGDVHRPGSGGRPPITISGGTAPVSLTPWVTSSTDNLASKTAIAVGSGAFTATLAGMTVTTFVGK